MISTRDTLQYQIATGRLTLPVAILLSLLTGGILCQNWSHVLSLGIGMLITGLMIEMNTTFALIRTRSTLPPALFLITFFLCPFLYSYSAESWFPLLFAGMLSSLFRSYESRYNSSSIFHAFLLIGIGSWVLPSCLFFIPFLYLHMIGLRSLSPRTFFAGIVGLSLPYWFMLCYGTYNGEPDFILTPFRQLGQDWIPDYSTLTLSQCISWGVFFLLAVISSTQNFQVSRQDKVQTRIMIQSLRFTGIEVMLLMLWQPQHFNALFPILIMIGAIMHGHLFALLFNRFTRYYFLCMLLLTLFAGIFNIWMHFFNS